MAKQARYAVELQKGKSPAAFMVNGRRVELDEKNPRFETADEAEYLGIRDLPFLDDLGEVKAAKKDAD